MSTGKTNLLPLWSSHKQRIAIYNVVAKEPNSTPSVLCKSNVLALLRLFVAIDCWEHRRWWEQKAGERRDFKFSRALHNQTPPNSVRVIAVQVLLSFNSINNIIKANLPCLFGSIAKPLNENKSTQSIKWLPRLWICGLNKKAGTGSLQRNFTFSHQ